MKVLLLVLLFKGLILIYLKIEKDHNSSDTDGPDEPDTQDAE